MRAMRFVVLSSVLAAVGCGGMEQADEQVSSDVTPHGLASISEAKVTGQAGLGNVTYHNGPIMTGTKHIYYIWYGNWAGNNAATVLNAFANGIGGSAYYNINSTYTQTGGAAVTNSATFAGSTTVGYTYGTSLVDANIQSIVADAINSGAFPLDTNGVYFVLTSADVTETSGSSGFCTSFCGWHSNGTINGATIKYSFVGNPDRCITSCAGQSTGPNGNAGADGMVSIVAHEFEETSTDPLGSSWYDLQGYENGDKCAWTWGTTSTAANGAKYNITLGGLQMLIQQNWEKTAKVCTMHYP
jgi:Phosphate-induced protein 1 conserved region